MDFSKIEKLIQDFQAGKYTDTARGVAAVVLDAADFIDQLNLGVFFSPEGFEAQLDAHCAALQGCCDHPPLKAPGDAVSKLDPAVLIGLIQQVVVILNLIRNWRKPATP